MTFEEMLEEYGDLIKQAIEGDGHDEDYILNLPQFKKFVDIVEFLKNLEDDSSLETEVIPLKPSKRRGDLNARFFLMHLAELELEKFCDVMRGATAMSIDAQTDGKVCLSVTVKDVYIHK